MKLNTMLEKHRAGEYFLHHWTGIFKGSMTARQACRRISRRAQEQGELAVKNDQRAARGAQMMADYASLLIVDLWDLPHSEFLELQKLNGADLMVLTTQPADDATVLLNKTLAQSGRG